ncbi:MAG: DNA polymerase III subunit gamma/tau [Deltaproteobacteria bacterium]|nr:DNA polymerase III subunit gamma/tau [Deltaproteobacteria bacterium]
MAYEVLARKWRPQVFEDVIGQDHVTRTLINAFKMDRLAHAYLFSGPRGVGKTSVARILAKAMNCKGGKPGIPCNRCHSCVEITQGSSVDVQEIDGASNRGIDEIRELRENIRYMPSSSPFRIYIIDEVHMLTMQAFNALLKTLEEPPTHVKFIFATTEAHKVPVTILSRCQKFDFKRIPLQMIIKQIEKVTREEGIEISKSGLSLIAGEADGSMRDAQSLLDQVISYTGLKVEDRHIIEILGIIDRRLIFEASQAVLDGSVKKCVQIVEQIYSFGYDLKEFYRALMDQFRNLLVTLAAPDEVLLDIIDNESDELKRQALQAGSEKLQHILSLLIAREENLRMTSHPRLVLEIIMVKLCRLGEYLSFEQLFQKLESLEKKLSSTALVEAPMAAGRLSDPGTGWQPKSAPDLPSVDSSGGINKKDWERFLEFLTSKNPAMVHVIKDWPLLHTSGDLIEIGKGGTQFTSAYLDEPERFQKLTELCRDFFKRDVQIKITPQRDHDMGGNKPPQAKPKHSNLPPPIQDVLDIFQGELKGEIAVKPNQGENTRRDE